jgi:precorrin-8X/cobalt-precorrin-8 methylmutase
MKPHEIERSSFQIIDQEAGIHHFTAEQWSIVRRIIHTTADFEFKEMIRFHPDAISAGIESIRNGKMIITDTNMARVGIRKKEVETYGGRVKCYINDPLIHEKAALTGGTRAKAAVDMAISEMKDGIYVVGNAPTALLRLIELIGEKKAQPALVIGLPVGFVNAAESKAALVECGPQRGIKCGRQCCQCTGNNGRRSIGIVECGSRNAECGKWR